ncbi:MAG: MBL fold metallo-hydrolase [Akkermansiaceae bacterium]|nr:MBL fold metallo-hydrolase [Akkermansiaceae bacterium]
MDSQDLNIRSYTGGMAQTNGYLLGSGKEGGACLLIDAPLGISRWLEKLGELPTDLLLTHQHYDHVEDVAKLAAKGVRLHAYAPYSDELTLEKLLQQSGIPIHVEPYTIENLLEGKAGLEAGGLEFSLEHVPGHSPDSVVFVHDGLAFGGDTLFAGGVGRADLPGGDMELLLQGIRGKLFTLPPETRVFPGHGPATTIATEQSTNPFL